MFQNFLWDPTFTILAKNREIAKVSFTKVSSFKVLLRLEVGESELRVTKYSVLSSISSTKNMEYNSS